MLHPHNMCNVRRENDTRKQLPKFHPKTRKEMSYPVRCTHCISLLKNCKAYRKAHYYTINEDVFIDVQTLKEANTIAQLEGHQEATFKLYNQIINDTEK